MPFTNLWLPMGTTKPRVEHFAPLMNRVERQLTSILSMLTHAEKLQLVNSVSSSLPTYTMCSVSVLVVVHEDIDRARRNCMRRNSNSNAKRKSLDAWRKYTRPKKGALVSKISEVKMWPFSSNILTNSSIERIFPE
jgi:hypothetical protein